MACGQKETVVDSRLKGLNDEIDSLLNEYHAAGLAVAIIEKGNTIYSRGFGYRDYEQKVPVDENTVFGIGSCSKAFTASLLGILEGKGKLSLDDSPSKYFENLEFATSGMNDSVTLKNVLTHSTGMASSPSECTAVLFTSSDKYDMIPRMKYMSQATGVGQEWIYNNLMYALAGMVAEKASGISLEDNWQKNIFDPLGMTNSYGDVEEASQNPNFSYGYAVDSITPSRVLPEDMTIRGAGGAIYSSVADMSKWMQLWLDEGSYGGQQLLPKDYVQAAQDTLVLLPTNPNDSLPVRRYYGYGWGNWDHKGFKRSEHSGGTSGYVSNVVLYPDEKLGIVVLTNQTTSSLPSKVNNIIVERLYPSLKERNLGVRFGQSFNIAPMDTPTIPDTIAAPAYPLSDLLGTYEHPGYGKVDIILEGKTLYADFPFTKFRLVYIGNDTYIDYFTEQVPHVYWNFLDLQFVKNANGEFDKVMIDVDAPPVPFLKI